MARPVKGMLYKRGGVWYGRWKIRGEEFRVSLETGDEREAQKMLETHVAPYRAARSETLRKQAVAALRTAEEVHAEAVATLEKEKNRVLCADLWTRVQASGILPEKKTSTTPYKVASDDIMNYAVKVGKSYMDMLDESDASEINADWKTRLMDSRRRLRLICASAIFNGLGMGNIFKSIKQPDPDKSLREALTHDEVVRLIDAADGEIKTILMIQAHTGLRASDACTLLWKEIKSGRLIRETIKTGAEVAFPIHQTLMAHIDGLPRINEFITPESAERYMRKNYSMLTSITNLMESIGIETTAPGKNQRRPLKGSHSLRHYFITECAKRGVPMEKLVRWIGHGEKSITRIYAHFGSDDFDDLVAAIPSVGNKTTTANEAKQ